MVSLWKIVWNLFVLFLLSLFAISFVLCKPTQDSWSKGNYNSLSSRQPRTLNMTMGMNILKDMMQNGMAFRPVPPPFPSLKNLFKVNGTQWRWVPLGSIIFNHNGKIIGG